MNKFNAFLADHGTKIIIGLLVLVYFKSCSINGDVDKIKKDLRATEAEIDTLASQIVNEDEMIFLIKTVPAWKTLRIEEISDKERISINALEEKEDSPCLSVSLTKRMYLIGDRQQRIQQVIFLLVLGLVL